MKKRVFALIMCLVLCFSLSIEAFAYTGVSSWAKAEVDAADALGIIPSSLQKVPLSGAMTRLDMCHMAVNLFEKITGTSLYPVRINHFTDTKDGDVCVAYELGIVSGYPDNTFRPTKTITRQEFSKIILNLLTVLGWSEDAQILAAFSDEAQVAAWAKEATARMIRLGIVTGSSGAKLNPKGSTSVEQACVMFLRAYDLLQDEGVGGPADPVGGEYVPGYTGASAWALDALRTMDLSGLLPESLQTCVMSAPITRAQMCEMAVLTYKAVTGKEPAAAVSAFTDTELPAAGQASALGLVSGFPDGTFRPDELLTRQQFFQITDNLLRACGYKEQTDVELLQEVYADQKAIGDWAYAPIATLYRMNIMRGDDQGRATPTKGTTCEQAIAMLMRTYDQVSAWCEAHPLKQIVGPLTSPDIARQVVDLALSYVGYPYTMAGASPSTGFDCSGLVYYVYKQFGYNLHRAGDGQALDGTAVNEADLRPGDILIFAANGTNSIKHVGIYIGNGKMVHAQNPTMGVNISDYRYDTSKYIYSIRRIIK